MEEVEVDPVVIDVQLNSKELLRLRKDLRSYQEDVDDRILLMGIVIGVLVLTLVLVFIFWCLSNFNETTRSNIFNVTILVFSLFYTIYMNFFREQENTGIIKLTETERKALLQKLLI